MKKKILGIFVCVLLIAAAVPAVESLKDSTKDSTVLSHPLTSLTGNWTEMQKLLAPGIGFMKQFGCSVALDDNTALIGACNYFGLNFGSVYVFTLTGIIWIQEAKLLALDGRRSDYFGWSVSLDGDTALIGAPYGNENGENSGSAYVFTRSGTTWTQQAKLIASDGAAWDYFGWSVSLDGDTALIGTPTFFADPTGPGSAYVFTRTGTIWTQQAKLLASDGATGDYFGSSVSLSGDTALIGADQNENNGVRTGSTYVFTRTGTTWTQQAILLASDGAKGDGFGCSVALDGDNALIGAMNDNGMMGSAYVFTRSNTTWTQQQKLIPTEETTNGWFGCSFPLDADWFGCSVSLAGDTALIGEYSDDEKGGGAGSAYVFTRSNNTWTQQQKLFASDGTPVDEFGFSVSLNDDTALIGAHWDDDKGEVAGSAYVFIKVSSDIEIDIKGGLGISAVITNHGTEKITNVAWQLQVKGGVLRLIDITMNGTIDIPPGGSRIIHKWLFFGFGDISIGVKVADVVKTATGTQLFIFSTVK